MLVLDYIKFRQEMIKIKKILNLSLISFALLIFGILSTNTVSAKENVQASKNSNVEITITNDKTGETTKLDPEDSTNSVSVSPLNSGVNSKQGENLTGYDVFIPIDKSSNLVTPYAEDGSSKKSGGVTARLWVGYNWNSSSGKLKLKTVRGNWTPSSNIYSVSNRKAIAQNGVLPGTGLKKLTKRPTINSFSYATGWGYQSVPTGQDGAMAESTAKIKVSGMSGISHTINVRVFVP